MPLILSTGTVIALAAATAIVLWPNPRTEPHVPTVSVSPEVTAGEWGRPAEFDRFSVLLQTPSDDSASYGCPTGPCPIISAPFKITAKDVPVAAGSFAIEASDIVGQRLAVTSLGMEDLPAGMTHATELKIWTSGQHMKDRLTIRVSSGQRTVVWTQEMR